VKSLLKDKTVLYVVLFFAITNFFGYILLKNYDAVMFMVLVGLITSYFSKNMIVILLSSIILTTFLTTTSTIKEGFAEGIRESDSGGEEEVDPSGDKGKGKGEGKGKGKGKGKENVEKDEENVEKDEEKLKEDKEKLKEDEEKSKKDKKKLQEFLNSKKENFNPVEAMAQLEPLMKSAEGMMGMLDKTNAIGRMEGLLTRMNDMQK